jgi:hypothetical protein
MVAMVGVMGVALATVVATIRREARSVGTMPVPASDGKESECKP